MIKEPWIFVWKLKYLVLIIFLIFISSFIVGYNNKEIETISQQRVTEIAKDDMIEYQVQVDKAQTKSNKFIASVSNIFLGNLRVIGVIAFFSLLIIPALYIFYIQGFLLGQFITINVAPSLMIILLIEYLFMSITIAVFLYGGFRAFKDLFKKIKEKRFKEILFSKPNKEDLIYLQAVLFVIVPLILLGALIESIIILA